MLDRLSPPKDRTEGQEDPAGNPILIGLFPGSRPTEIKYNLPLVLKTAALLQGKYGPRVRFILPVAGTLDPQPIRQHLRLFQTLGVEIEVVEGDTPAVLGRCRLALVASGTVTLEAAIFETPMVIVYKVAWLNYWIARFLIDVPYVGLVNWVAGSKIVPEYLQHEARPEALAEAASRFIEDPSYTRQVREALRRVREKLGSPGASARVARLAQEMMG